MYKTLSALAILAISVAAQGPAKQFAAARKTFRAAPAKPGSQARFMRAWGELEKAGFFNCGASEKQAQGVLGEPDKVIEKSKKKSLIYEFMVLNTSNGVVTSVVDRRGLPKKPAVPLGRLDWKPGDDQKWTVGFRMANKVKVLNEYVRVGETVQDWRELTTFEFWPKMRARLDAAKFVDSFRKRLEQIAKAEGAKFTWNILAKNASKVVYEWTISGGAKRRAERELATMINAERDIYRIAYTCKGLESDAERRAGWIDALKASRFVLSDAGRKWVQENLRRASKPAATPSRSGR